MHNNYYFLRHLTEALRSRIEGSELIECFSQNKNELILGFDSNGEEFFIKAHLSPSFCCLHFPEEFHRANRNSVDLFKSLKGKKVKALRQFINERCFAIIFQDEQKLLFKMHGNRSNIISFSAQNEITSIFNSKLKNDQNIDFESIDRPIDQSKEAFIKAEGSYKALFPTFGKRLKNELKKHNFSEKSLENKWTIITNILHQLEDPTFYVVESDQDIYLSLLDEDEVAYKDPIEAINAFFLNYIKTESLRTLKNSILSDIDKTIKQSTNYITKSTARLDKVKNSTNYSQLADLIMANLHNIKSNTKEVTLEDFYNENKPIKIKLKDSLSPQKNAENYYRKSKNQVKEIDSLESSIKSKENLLLAYEMHREEILNIEDYKALKKYIDEHNLGANQIKKEERNLPYHEYEILGYKIYVGNNAKNNDKMLREHSSKDDLWLHAKDVSGSHVLIKQQPGKNFPKPVIEKAAQLAAFHSKRKTDSLCPVIVTPRKFVRKRKGDPAGAVVIEKEEVILVEPSSY